MRVLIVTPAPRGSRSGNRVTAERWRRLLRSLGHRVILGDEFCGTRYDLLVALHARKSAASIFRFREACPRRPVILALTGTDLYGDIHRPGVARRSLELADRLVVLQPHGLTQLPTPLHAKARVIYQSVERPPARPRRLTGTFEVCAIGHLREVKDPFRAAAAARHLPETSRIRVVHMGAALTPDMERRAREEMRRNPRYLWLGELARWQVRRRLARSHLLALTSRMEGGANVVSEAIAAGVPVVSSRISGSIGLLGENYPGFFTAGDTRELTALMRRCEEDRAFLRTLERSCRSLRPLVSPRRERASWARLLAEFR
ncbi:MAG: TIGR04348 family glycosyltransferase [Planctomycetes bacterium]|nr:TIGR04348 family glycosyltransferase [Planctomycetota bacterium]